MMETGWSYRQLRECPEIEYYEILRLIEQRFKARAERK